MLLLAHFIHQSPSELVQFLHEEAQRQGQKQGPIVLWLDVDGWPKAMFLRFASDLIFAGPSKIDLPSETDPSSKDDLISEISLQKAELIALDFYLNLRMAAALAIRIRHFEEAHGMYVDEAIKDWALWEAGYYDFLNMDDCELGMIMKRIQTLQTLHSAGRRVLKAQEGKRRGAGRIRVHESVLSMAPRPPEEMGIRWGTGKTPNGWDAKRLRVDAPQPGSFVTHLAAWLALPPNEIVERITRVAKEASPAGRVILGLDAPDTPKDPRRALIFEKGSVFLASIVGEAIAPAHETISVQEAIELVAEWKLRLRRAAVYAALVGAKAKRRRNVEDWIRLDALAAFGFAKGKDVPDEAWVAIEKKKSELFELYETGLFVLEACSARLVA
jgi:hypothetical protein